MTAHLDAYDEALRRADSHAREWLGSLKHRPVPPRASIDELAKVLGGPLPDGATDPAEVIDLLATGAEPGLTAMPSGRFFGFVIGGTHPAGLAADWLVSAWDQNSGLRQVTPAHTAIEDAAAAWLLDLLGLPTEAAVGFVTGATMANFTGLAAGRHAVLARQGWDVEHDGLTGAPRVRTFAGAERHETVDLALRYLGLGAPELVAVDKQGRIRVDALAEALEAGTGPAIVCLQAGNIHSGDFDPFTEAIALARAHGAWVHVDGAFGLWAGASPQLRHLVAGYEGADSWATDAHKTLNVPYDCGVVIVRDPAMIRSAMTMHGDYLLADEQHGDPHERVPELSRRGRAFTVWAVLRSLGRSGVADLVDGLVSHARALAEGVRGIDGGEVLNDVTFTQVCTAFGSDDRTRAVTQALMNDGTAWMTGSRWRGRDVLRISVSNWSTDDADVEASLGALRKAAATALA
jgi:glutamate/tyrosine decarboxylase-like PLP-dependent enzyme